MTVTLPRALVVSITLALSACASRGPAPVPGAAWLPQVEAIAAGSTTTQRGSAITRQLDALGIRWQAQRFPSEKHGEGVNIVAELGGEGPLLLIGAHYDRVEVGNGVTDNASGSAAVLELAAALQAQPLAHHRVQLAFWDLEEKGLLGSAAWVAANPNASELYVNFDVFGWGDTLWVMAPASAQSMSQAITAAGDAAELPSSIGEQYPPTDHLSFLQAKQPAVSLSLIAGEEIPHILTAFSGKAPAQMPKVMKVIHSANDQLDQLDTAAVQRALPVVLDALRRWDREHPGNDSHAVAP